MWFCISDVDGALYSQYLHWKRNGRLLVDVGFAFIAASDSLISSARFIVALERRGWPIDADDEEGDDVVDDGGDNRMGSRFFTDRSRAPPSLRSSWSIIESVIIEI